MAEASAAVERRKASASRWTRGRARSANRWQHLIAWRGPTGQLRLFGAPPPLIFWRQKICGFGRQNSGAKCVAGTTFHAVIAGLDPAIHTELRLALPSPFLSLHFSMDHRVKPGGDERKKERRRNSAPSREAPSPHPLPARGERESQASREEKFSCVTSSTSAWRCRSGFSPCLRRTAARCASTPAPAGS
jgi:hypothetical protein